MRLTAPWVRERASSARQRRRGDGGGGGGGGSDVADIELCALYEGLDAAGPDGRLEAGGLPMQAAAAVWAQWACSAEHRVQLAYVL